MRRLATIAVLAMLLFSSASAQETTAYVTDVLRLGMHNAADTSDRAFRSLESGQQMQILERSRLYARVRLPDGTEGYVKAAYLVDDKPARLIVEEVRTQAQAAEQALRELRDEYSGSATRIDTLETSLEEARTSLAEVTAQYNEAREINAGYEQKMRLYGFSLPWPIALGAMLISLVLGFAGGFWWIDSRSRRRHGGFRIY